MGSIYSMAMAPATAARRPPETRLATPALVVGTADWEAEELAALELALALVLLFLTLAFLDWRSTREITASEDAARTVRASVTDKVEAVDTAGLVEHALQQLYGEESGDSVPKEVLVPALPEDPEAVSQWLADRRGSQVSLRIPQRGDKKDLMVTVQRNAQQCQALGIGRA